MVYEPLEDSFLLQKWVKKTCKDKTVLDMGTGNGIQAITAAVNSARRVVAVDIDDNSLEYAKSAAKLKNATIEFRQSDLFSNIYENEEFDIIVFNPPYFPNDELFENTGLTGGKIGNELTIRFIKESASHLSRKGFLLVILSSISNPESTFNEAKKAGFDYQIMEESKLDNESLYCVKFTLKK